MNTNAKGNNSQIFCDEGTQLAILAKKGDREAFEKLVKMHEKFVYATVYFDVKNKDDAYDISQEIFIRVYRSLSSFRADSAFSSWLYRICKNSTYDFLRKSGKNNALSISELGAEDDEGKQQSFDIPDTSESSNPSDAAEKNELKEVVQKAISKLSNEHKAVIILRDIEGYSYSDIANLLGIEEGTVKSRISRARDILKKLLHDYHSNYK